MEIAIHQPVGFNETGGRSNNEDSIFPAPETASVSDTLFLVCDGVGGEHKGEIASLLACQCLSEYFMKFPLENLTMEYIQSALDYTRQQFEDTENRDAGTQGMATTMTLLCIVNSRIIIAHLGDSRIYHIRNGKIIYQTKDHKWVNELVEGGLITEEQALEHPKRNVITKVISAGRHDQPDVKIITDIQPGDYFFMCTDGVLEQLYDELLTYHLRDYLDNSPSTADIMKAIKEKCEGKTNDNFSAYLIKIKSVNRADILAENEKTFHPIHQSPNTANSGETKNSGIIYSIVTLVILLLLAGATFYLKYKPANKPAVSKVVIDSSLINPYQNPVKSKKEFSYRKLKKEKKSQVHQVSLMKKKKNSYSEHVPTDSSLTIPRPVSFQELKPEDDFTDVKPAVVKSEIPVLPKKEQQPKPENDNPEML